MIDFFAIVLTHLLLLVAAWRLLDRADLARDPVALGARPATMRDGVGPGRIGPGRGGPGRVEEGRNRKGQGAVPIAPAADLP